MTDQCKHCAYRSDTKSCLAADCFQHESWYARMQQERIDELTHRVNIQADVIEKLERQIHEEPRF